MANNKKKKKPIKVSVGVSWIYIILLLGIAWMFFNQSGGNPQKEEWADVQAQWLAGDIKEITFIRNEYEGHVTIKPERIEKYSQEVTTFHFPRFWKFQCRGNVRPAQCPAP